MKLPIYQVDAFTSKAFGGNPAAVCPLTAWLDDALMQSIAAENNLAETAFFVPNGDGYHIRWFTPEVEIDLCGHATVASAYVIFERLTPGLDRVTFASKSGPLHVFKDRGRIALDFPSNPPIPCDPPPGLAEALGKAPGGTLRADAYFCVYETEADVRALAPDMAGLNRLDRNAVIVTAPGTDVDFVSRFFAPKLGVPEDPVTGSAHCKLVPYWAQRLGKNTLRARQVSARGGELWCEARGERAIIAGSAAPYLEGTIEI
jgi:predicted PhzF superfamily epimerase YddE/YHI9